MADHTQDVEQQRAELRKQLSEDAGREEEDAAEEAALAPPGHLGQRMTEGERRERSGT